MECISTKSKRSFFTNYVQEVDFNSRKKISRNMSSLPRSDIRFPENEEIRCSIKNVFQYNSLNPTHLDDTSTQTSKTILELAKLEMGNMSPDSLDSPPILKTNGDCSNFDRYASFEQKNLDRVESSTELQKGDQYYAETICHSDNWKNESGDNSSNEGDSLVPINEEKKSNAFTIISNRSEFLQQPSPIQRIMKLFEENKSKNLPFCDTHHPNFVPSNDHVDLPKAPQHARSVQPTAENTSLNRSSSSLNYSYSSIKNREKPSISYMASTISSEKKDTRNMMNRLNELFISTYDRKPIDARSHFIGKNSKNNESIPFTDRISTFYQDDHKKESFGWNNEDRDSLGTKLSSKEITSKLSDVDSNFANENFMSLPLSKLKNSDWNIAIQGLAHILEYCQMADMELIFPYMTIINQRVIDLLRSPRSHVCRTACKAIGQLFEFARDTRRPEFDELVDLLLSKTADANKFIRQDANMALDCMVTHISCCHSLRALCSKGPSHKNFLVRIATVRLIVCAVVIAGADSILNPNNADHTRRRIFCHLPKFIEDKNIEVRKFGERLYKILSKETRFEVYLKKYLDREEVLRMKRNLQDLTFRA